MASRVDEGAGLSKPPPAGSLRQENVKRRSGEKEQRAGTEQNGTFSHHPTFFRIFLVADFNRHSSREAVVVMTFRE